MAISILLATFLWITKEFFQYHKKLVLFFAVAAPAAGTTVLEE